MDILRRLGYILLFYTVMISIFLSSSIYGSDSIPTYLQDRGSGIATSMFGAYVEKGHFLNISFL